MSIGENMKKQRLALGMTLEEVAEKIGVTRQTMSRYETGVINNYSPETISEIAEALQTTGSCLLGYDERVNTEIESESDVKIDNASIATEFAKKLRKLRLDKGCKQEDVANSLGLSKQVISTYERGLRSPSYDTLIKIADLFDVSTDYLLRADNKVDVSIMQNIINSARKIGERIGKLRKNTGLTMDEVATALGTIRQTIYKYEHGIVSNIPAENIVKLAQLFNVSSDYILGLSEKPTHEEARLKSCPFCGGEASFYPDYLQCMNCLATMPYRYGLSFEEGKKMATNSWNRRKGG